MTHENYLRKFTELFRRVDTETNGVVDEGGLRTLLGLMGINDESQVDRLLQIVDPHNNQRITYSETLSLLSSVCKIAQKGSNRHISRFRTREGM